MVSILFLKSDSHGKTKLGCLSLRRWSRARLEWSMETNFLLTAVLKPFHIFEIFPDNTMLNHHKEAAPFK